MQSTPLRGYRLDPRQALQQAAAFERSRRFAEAQQLYLAMLKTSPRHVPALEGAARTATQTGQHQAAAVYLRAAVRAEPERTALRHRLAAVLLQSGDLAGAEETARELADKTPEDAGALNLLGVICKRRNRVDEALALFQRAAAVNGADHAPWYNLGNTLLAMGQYERALAALEQAATLRPQDAETQRLLGQALAGADRPEGAMAAFARAEDLDPRNARIFTSRAAALQRAGAGDAEVLEQLDRAIALEPANLAHLRGKALFLQRRNRFAEAEAVHRAVLERDPDDIETLLRLGHLLGYSLRRYEDANGFLRHALSLRPDDPRCLSAMCKSLLDSRYGDEGAHINEAGEVAHRLLDTGIDLVAHAANLSGVFLRLADFAALRRLPDRATLMPYWVDRMNVGSLHNQLGRVVTGEDRRELVRWHREWGRRVIEQAAKTPIRPPAPLRAPRAKIRVGLMSSDLRDHPVAYFALPIIEHYDRSRFEFVCYSFYPAPPDRVQSFVQQRVAATRSMLQASDAEIAQQIADDRLDILFELGGSTRYNRLEVMAYRAAPVQASWLGYPHSAGLETIDYILVDPYIRPEDPALLIERPLEMPESWVSLGRLGFRDQPVEPGLPEERQGALTFGTMNNPYKYTPEIFALWAAVMRRVDGSRFLFVRPEAGAARFRTNVCSEFEKHGVAADRIDFVAVRGRHLQYYNRIDIALDTAPHTGGTTTCETLWMGVPVVTLVGEAFFERLSYSNLVNAGLADLCTFAPAQFVEAASALAADRRRRRDLRDNLRSRLRQTPLGDAVRWVRSFETTVAHALGRA
jgi:predicted O-linked N-acetylglucosamine transferase (SPINDLY family)